MPAREKRRLAELEQQDAALCRNEESIISVRQSFFFKCRYIYRPIQILLGLLLFSFVLLIFISLLLSNINKCLNFVDFKQIFAQGNQTLPNPIDLVLTWTGKVETLFGFCIQITILFVFEILVLSDQLHPSIEFTCLYHSNIIIRFTTNWHLVFLDSSEFFVFFCIIEKFILNL